MKRIQFSLFAIWTIPMISGCLMWVNATPRYHKYMCEVGGDYRYGWPVTFAMEVNPIEMYVDEASLVWNLAINVALIAFMAILVEWLYRVYQRRCVDVENIRV